MIDFSEKEFIRQNSEYIKTETNINHRKRCHYRNQASTAAVRSILSGEGENVKDTIFPVNPNHQMVLAISKKLAATNPDIIPPEVPRRSKWLGEDKGWGK